MKRLFLYLLLSGFSAGLLISQQNDAGLWSTLELERKINPRVSLSLQQETRFGYNISQLDHTHLELGFKYRISRILQTGLEYRFVNKIWMRELASLRHRISWNITASLKKRPFTIKYRQLIFSEFINTYSSRNGYIPEVYTRSKVTLKLGLRRLNPFVAGEIYMPLVRTKSLPLCQCSPGSLVGWPDKYRFITGVSYELNKLNELELNYLFQRQINRNDPFTEYIIGIAFIHAF